jgi:hypothetical protein
LQGEGAGVVTNPHGAINEAGEAVITWSQASDANASGDIYVNRFSSANNWGTPTALESMAEGEARFPQIALNESDAIVVWTEFDGNNFYSVYGSILNGDEPWSAPTLLEDSVFDAGNSNAAGALVKLDNTGRVTVAWEQDIIISETSRSENRLFLNRFDISTTPSPADVEKLAQADLFTEAFRPALGIDAQGGAIVVSQHLLSNSLDIQAHNFAPKQD